jgi:hypothetical protein
MKGGPVVTGISSRWWEKSQGVCYTDDYEFAEGLLPHW